MFVELSIANAAAATTVKNLEARNDERRSDATPQRRELPKGLVQDIDDLDSYTEESIFTYHDQRQTSVSLLDDSEIDSHENSESQVKSTLAHNEERASSQHRGLRGGLVEDISDLDSYTEESIFAHHNQRQTSAKLHNDSEVESHEDIESQVKSALSQGGLRAMQRSRM